MSQLKWTHVAATEHSWTLDLDSGVTYNSLTFGISVQQLLPIVNQTTSSGITWADCVYKAHAGKTLTLNHPLTGKGCRDGSLIIIIKNDNL